MKKVIVEFDDDMAISEGQTHIVLRKTLPNFEKDYVGRILPPVEQEGEVLLVACTREKEMYRTQRDELRKRLDKTIAALQLAKDMFIANGVSLPNTFEVMDEALKLNTAATEVETSDAVAETDYLALAKELRAVAASMYRSANYEDYKTRCEYRAAAVLEKLASPSQRSEQAKGEKQ